MATILDAPSSMDISKDDDVMDRYADIADWYFEQRVVLFSDRAILLAS